MGGGGSKRSRSGDSFLLVVLEAQATFCKGGQRDAHGAGASAAIKRITVIQTGERRGGKDATVNRHAAGGTRAPRGERERKEGGGGSP